MKRMLQTYGAGFAASVVVASWLAFMVAIFAEPAASQQSVSPPETVAVVNRLVGTTSGVVTLTTSTSSTLAWASSAHANDVIVTVAVPPERLGDLLVAIADRGVAVSVHAPMSYCRPDRERVPVAQPDVNVDVAAR